MKRNVLVVTATLLFAASGTSVACGVSGTAFNAWGKPLQDAVVRLVDLTSGHEVFGTTSASGFMLDANGVSSPRMRIDVLGAPTRVVGSHIPTRSIIGQSPEFACSSAQITQDVHVQID